MTRDIRRGRSFISETSGNVYYHTTSLAWLWLPPKMSKGLQR